MEKQIDFKFAKNWKTFENWHKTVKSKSTVPDWDIQKEKIQALFESSNRNLVDWSTLWFKLTDWFNKTQAKNKQVLWSEQRRQIETLMLTQLKDFGKEVFVLVYLYNGSPEVDTNKMTYWETLRTKETLAGDKNGRGGNEEMDKITIVNLNSLIK